MAATRREFLLSTLGAAVAGRKELNALAGHPLQGTLSAENSRGDGSGHFGQWIEDGFGLPAYRYTCNQSADPKALTALTPGILAANEHLHQVGNDRITALASNFGTVRVRQDEGVPKLLNDIDPETSQFGGGVGYLTDGDETLSTYTDGSDANFQRTFGIGYFRKQNASPSYSIDQGIYAPFGDDPVLLSQVTIANRSDRPATVRWIEYWGCQPYPFSFRAFIESWSGIGTPVELRRRFGRSFSHQVSAIKSSDGAGVQGLLESKHFNGRSQQEEHAWQQLKAMLRNSPNTFLSPVDDLQPGTDFDSTDLPPTFLVSLDEPASGFSTDGAAFFGAGGVSHPAGLSRMLGGAAAGSREHTALLLERTVHLKPKEERTLSFLYGYLPEGFKLDELIARYKLLPSAYLPLAASEWKKHGMRFEVAAEPWIERESTWNYYYLRSSRTYDDYFGEHILNQNGFYQYVMGFQGAARDPLQHALPFLFSDPEIVRSVLRYTLKEVRDDGSLPYGIVGHGVIAPMATDNASDLPLWLLWAVSEYVLATRDTEFLKEKIPARFSKTAGRDDTVRNLLERCYRHQTDQVGTGRHGLARMLNDDWNDGLMATFVPADRLKECVDQGESVLNSAMSAWVFDEYARLLRYAGDSSGLDAEASRQADEHRKAVRGQWTGQWFRRAWLGPALGWIGESTLWIEQQPWAILGGATDAAQSRQLIQTIDQQLRRGPLGAAQMNDGPEAKARNSADSGSLEHGAIWPSLNQTLVWALAAIDPAMAWDEWKKNSFTRHANAYPRLWYGIWSGNDSYNSPLSRNPGGAANESYFHGTDFPILNLHSHACFLYSAAKLLGMEFTETGLRLRPGLPAGPYRFTSTLVGLSRSPEGIYSGWYAPSRAGHWTIEITLPAQTAKNLARVEINGVISPLSGIEDGKLTLSGTGSTQAPLRWRLL